ncbi:O-antigen ligase family protein [Marinospirillum perlucidum]|uniref:O-antigen ligase family protein n=1 Tax=Marinospirillum perlucidum TaxID=1982602 RepID=UPI000DF42957|nr:O-antigen ligase family protein [Marinospirillum perlucidum]
MLKWDQLWQAPSNWSAPRYWYWLLVFLSLFFAVGQLGLKDEIKPLVYLLTLSGLYVLCRYHPELRFSPLPLMGLAALIIPLISWGLVVWQNPDLASSSPRSEDLADKFLFIFPALVLAGSSRNTLIFWGMGLVAALSLPWVEGSGFSELQAAAEGQRTGFGRHIISMGIVHGTFLLGLFAFFSRLVMRPRFSWWRFLLWAFLVGYLTFTLLASQSRAVYLGMLLALFLGLLMLAWHYCKQSKQLLHHGKVYALILLVAIGSVKLFEENALIKSSWERTQKEIEVYQLVLAGDWDQIPQNSAGLRIHFWKDVLAWSQERPIFGWGYGAGQKMHQEADNWFGDRYFITVHNDFLELLITYGLVGVGFILFFYAYVFWSLFRAWKHQLMDSDFFAFFILFFAFFLINGVFLTNFLFRDTIYLFNLIMAGAAGYIIRMRWLRDGG